MPEAAGAAGPRRAAAGMLVVRREQMQLFRDLLTQDFRLRLERQLRRVHSARMQDLGAEPADRLIRRCIERAAGYGLNTERTIALYAHLCVGLGWDFEARPECRELAHVLCESADENAKMYLAYRSIPPTLRATAATEALDNV